MPDQTFIQETPPSTTRGSGYAPLIMAPAIAAMEKPGQWFKLVKPHSRELLPSSKKVLVREFGENHGFELTTRAVTDDGRKKFHLYIRYNPS